MRKLGGKCVKLSTIGLMSPILKLDYYQRIWVGYGSETIVNHAIQILALWKLGKG